MSITISKISKGQANKIINLREGHFLDLKSVDCSPSKMTKHIAAFANADGGEIYIGIEDRTREWRGFETPENANSIIQVIEPLFPIGQDTRVQTQLSHQ